MKHVILFFAVLINLGCYGATDIKHPNDMSLLIKAVVYKTSSPSNVAKVKLKPNRVILNKSKSVKAAIQTQLDITSMGAIPNNPGFDNGAIINNCIHKADSLNMEVFVPAGSFYVNKKIILGKTALRGVLGSSKIIFSANFRFNSNISDQSASCISNSHFSTSFSSSADKVYISDIDFEMNVHIISKPYEVKILALANVSAGAINNCVFKINEGLGINATCVDVFAAVRNVKFTNCSIENYNQALIGGGMYIRNVAYVKNGAYNEEDNTENITVDGCHFKNASKDEALSIFGSTGKVEYIKILNSDFISLPSSIKHDAFVTVFPMNKADRPFAAVLNVLFDNCIFKDNNFNFYVFRCGSYDGKPCGNITVQNCKFIISKSFITTKNGKNIKAIIAKNLSSVGGPNVFINNQINSSGVELGLDGFDVISKNVIKGSFEKLFNNSRSISDNQVN